MIRQLPKPFKVLLLCFFLSTYVWATPECPIITGKFQLPNGTTSDPSATGWYLDASNVSSTGYFAVKSNRIMAQTIGGEGIWYSRVFSTAGYSSFQAAVKITAEGLEDNTEYAKIYYIIDGGPMTLLDQRTGNWGTIDFTSGTLTGSTIQLVVKLYNYSHGTQASKYYIEQYRVFKEKGPCSVSAITVTPTASNGGVLTCTNSSLALSATATGSGTTTWSWSGPNGFTSTAQSPTVTAAGTYTVVATNSTGTGSASITLTANQTGPTVTATGGSVGCGSSLTLTAASSAGSSSFSWTGPNNFTSSEQNPSVTTPGTYTVTVTDASSGCSTSQSVTVTAGAVASTIWLEDFTGLANGTTSDTGATAWTATTTGTGTYSVQNGEFKTSFSGQTEGVWTSQAIDISSKTNVTFSVDLRSETASSSDFFETADYVRVYYVLDGGTPVLAYEDLAGIGTSTTGTSSMTFNSATLSGSTLQIIIKTNDSDPTERYFFDNIKVVGTSSAGISATATAGGIITCTNTSVPLLATSGTSGVSYSWTGPNSYTSTAQNPVVTTPGIYTLVVSNSATGCSGTDTALVTANTTAPTVSANNGGAITCRNVSVSISGTVSASGSSYSWAGPNGFTSSALSATVTQGGTYTLTATDPANGCSGSAATVVAENTVVPGNLVVTNSGTITCLTGSVSISGNSSTAGVTYSWTGPNGYTSSTASATVTHGGLYTLMATDPVNGCNATKSTTVAENTTVPAVTIGNTSPLSCTNQTVTLTANTTVANASYLWIGPGDFIDVNAVTTTNVAGNYTLTVTDPANGCTNTVSSDVTGSPNCSARKVTGSIANTPAATVNTFTYSAYPNPLTSNGVIQFTSPASTTVSVGIYNTLGSCEKVLFKGVATANQQYRLTVPVDQLAAGAHYYIINTNGKVYTGKLVVVR